MPVKSVDDIIRLIKNRDNLTILEARNIVEDCMRMIKDCVETGGGLEEIEDILREELGLEPDYLEILLEEITFGI